MTSLQRIANVALSLLMIACGGMLLLNPQVGLVFAAVALGIALVLYGVRKLVFYLTMARYMVGGLSSLFIAIIAIDVGVFSLVLVNDPRISIVLYLVTHNIYTGVLSIARGVESKLFESRWVLRVAHGLVNIALAAVCIISVGSDEVLMTVFCIGLFYNALVRLVSAFRTTEIIYIQ